MSTITKDQINERRATLVKQHAALEAQIVEQQRLLHQLHGGIMLCNELLKTYDAIEAAGGAAFQAAVAAVNGGYDTLEDHIHGEGAVQPPETSGP